MWLWLPVTPRHILSDCCLCYKAHPGAWVKRVALCISGMGNCIPTSQWQLQWSIWRLYTELGWWVCNLYSLAFSGFSKETILNFKHFENLTSVYIYILQKKKKTPCVYFDKVYQGTKHIVKEKFSFYLVYNVSLKMTNMKRN